MYYHEHAPPHFHAFYGEYEVVIDIHSGKPIKGKFPRRELQRVERWCKIHKDQLLMNWDLAQNAEQLKEIEPYDE